MEQVWIFMTYESATNVRRRSRSSSRKVGKSYRMGRRYPPIEWARLGGLFNRTLSFRSDADAVVTHGDFVTIPRDQEKNVILPEWTTKFDNYTKDNFRDGQNKKIAPVIWFVSHCKSESGRDRYVRQLRNHIGVHIYGKILVLY